MNIKHSWVYYFDEKPDLGRLAACAKEGASDVKSSEITIQTARSFAFVFGFQQNWRIVYEVVDWKWWGLQERSFSPADSQEVFQISHILL